MENIQEELRKLREERDIMLEGLERCGWPCRLIELPDYCLALVREIQRLKGE